MKSWFYPQFYINQACWPNYTPSNFEVEVGVLGLWQVLGLEMEGGGPGDSRSSMLGLGHMTFASKQTKSKAGEDHRRGARVRAVLWDTVWP